MPADFFCGAGVFMDSRLGLLNTFESEISEFLLAHEDCAGVRSWHLL